MGNILKTLIQGASNMNDEDLIMAIIIAIVLGVATTYIVTSILVELGIVEIEE